MDTAPLRRLPDRGQLAGLVWEAPAEPAARHAQLFQAVIRAHEGGRAWAAERFWQQALTLWSQARAANCAALQTRPAHGRDQVLARSSRSAGPRPRPGTTAARDGDPSPHVHNIVLMNLTTGFSARAQESRPYGSGEPDRVGVGYGDRIPPLGLVPARPSA